MGYKSNSKFFVLDNIIELGREVWRKTKNVGNKGFIRLIQIIASKWASKDAI